MAADSPEFVDFADFSLNDDDDDVQWIEEEDLGFGYHDPDWFPDSDFYQNLSATETGDESRNETLDETRDETLDETRNETLDETRNETRNETLDETRDETLDETQAPVTQFSTKDCDLCNESESSLFIIFKSIYLCEECLKRVCPAHVITFLDATAKKARTMCYICWNSHRNGTLPKSEKEKERQLIPVAAMPKSNQIGPMQKSKRNRRKAGSALGKLKETTPPTLQTQKSSLSVSPSTHSPKNVQITQCQKKMGWIPTAPVNKNMIKFNKNQNK